jgi:phosphopantothenoylcysteine decarboxylase / phosphopantothenate---cysteine ligase
VAEVLLGVSGGIAAYKAIDVMRILQRGGHGVTVVMTRAARRFVGPATFAALSGRPVGTDLFGAEERPGYGHLELARRADLMLVAPASANTIAKLAAGLADGLLGSAYLAFDGPVVIAPAMNTRMWTHPATTRNLGLLAERGVQVVEPASGLLADGEVGMGRLAEPAEIAAAVEARLAGAGTLAGRRVLVSAGGTREPIDPVRYVGNRSTGRMGWAVAEAARRRGADVTVLASNVDLPRHPDVRYVDAPTAADLRRAALDAFGSCDVLVMAAAVADFAPAAARQGKIDKAAEGRLALELEPTADILTELAGRHGQVVVGFAAEHGAEGLARARAKRERKRLDLIVHNDVSVEGIGFGSADNAITIIGADGETTLPRMSKDACAERILDAVVSLLPPGLGTEPSPER